MGIIVLTPADLVAFIALPVWAVATSILIWTGSAKVSQESTAGDLSVPGD